MRQVLKHSRSIVVKIGTEIVHSENGMLAMGQIGAIVEQARQVLRLDRLI